MAKEDQDRRGRKDPEVTPGRSDLGVQMAIRVIRVHEVQLVCKEVQVNPEFQELKVCQEKKEQKESRDSRDSLVKLVHVVSMVLQVQRDLEALRVTKDFQ